MYKYFSIFGNSLFDLKITKNIRIPKSMNIPKIHNLCSVIFIEDGSWSFAALFKNWGFKKNTFRCRTSIFSSKMEISGSWNQGNPRLKASEHFSLLTFSSEWCSLPQLAGDGRVFRKGHWINSSSCPFYTSIALLQMMDNLIQVKFQRGLKRILADTFSFTGKLLGSQH